MAAEHTAYTKTMSILRDLALSLDVARNTGPVDEIRASQAFRRQSMWLSQALQNDHSYMESIYSAAYPADADALPRRYFNLVGRIAHELATLYAHRVDRRFDGDGASVRADNGQRRRSEWVRKLQEIYGDLDVNGLLHEMERGLKVQRYQVAVVLPSAARPVELWTADPWEVYVKPGNPRQADDIQQAAQVRIRCPVEANDTKVRHGWLVFEPGLAYIEDGDKRIGVYAPDLSNPLGRYPLVTAYASKPRRGWHFPAVSQDLMSMQISANLLASDQEHGLKYSWPQPFIDPGNQGGDPQEWADSMPRGIDKIPAIQTPGGKMGVLHFNPPIAAFQSLMMANMRTLAILWDMSPDSFMKEATAKTAVSRAFDRADRDEARQRAAKTFARVENDLARTIAATLNLRSLVRVPDDVSIRIEYRHHERPADPVHAAQARNMDILSGVSTAWRYVRERDNISEAAAKVRVRQNLRETRSLQLGEGAEAATKAKLRGATLVFDIDGTIATLAGRRIEDAEPIADRIDAINKLAEMGNRIIIHTARPESMRTTTQRQLEAWGVKFDQLVMGKPAGDAYIDDKGSSDLEFFGSTN